MRQLTCQLVGYPDYYSEHDAFTMSNWYSDDVLVRNGEKQRIIDFMEKEYGTEMPKGPNRFQLVSPYTSIQIFLKLLGAEMKYDEKNFADTSCCPLKDVEETDQLDEFEEIFKNNAYQWMETLKADVAKLPPDEAELPLVIREMDRITDMFMVHCPLTIGYKLFGENLLFMQYDDPELAVDCFNRIGDWSLWLRDLICKTFNRPEPERVLLSSCSACFVQPEYYRDVLVPVLQRIHAGKKLFFHSCGTINRHLEAFHALHETNEFLKLDCRESSRADIEKISRLFPGVEISYMLSPALCQIRDGEEVRRTVRDAVEKTGDNPLHLIMMMPEKTKPEVGHSFLDEASRLGFDIYPSGDFRFV